MTLRQTQINEVDTVMEIIDAGKAYLKSQGIDQWQQGYPNRETILEDIENGQAYVLEHQGQIVGTTMISFSGEPTYEHIEGSGWLTHDQYAVLHRLAIIPNFKGQGLGVSLIDQAADICREKGIYSIKIDTHEENKSMQNMLKKAGFANCGIIYLDPADGEIGRRIAFEKVLK